VKRNFSHSTRFRFLIHDLDLDLYFKRQSSLLCTLFVVVYLYSQNNYNLHYVRPIESIVLPLSIYRAGLGIIVGMHRLWSHRSFEASLPLRVFLMFCASIANEGSIFHWVRDHRVHHKYSETDADPHNATRGFFFAHVGWLLIKKHPDVTKAGREFDMSDMLADPVVRFQKKCDPWINVYMCFFFPAQFANYFWGEDFWNAFWVAGFLRYVIVLHFTWFVNSAAHLYGDHPYDTASYPAENPFVAWVTGGEGWHNWHHKYPYDYATSEFGGLAQFNLGKGAIELFCWLGLASNPKRATAAWTLARARRDREKEAGIPLPRAKPRYWELDSYGKAKSSSSSSEVTKKES